MNERQPELEVTMSRDANVLDDALKAIWEKARAVGEVITQLRGGNRILSERVSELERSNAEQLRASEREIAALRSELLAKEQELKRLRVEHSQLLSANGHHSFSGEEREILRSRIRELITKINSYL